MMKLTKLILTSVLLSAALCSVWGQEIEPPEKIAPLLKSDTFKVKIRKQTEQAVPVALKTNVALLGATVANLGGEVGFRGRWSVDVPLLYSPYTVKESYKLRILAIQPEARYWLDKHFNGHFFGLHAHLGWFNAAVGPDWRYQSRGNAPVWGVGVSYGYNLPLAQHWGAEFTVGAGYARIPFEKYYNVHNGALYGTGTKNYWGITRAGITLVYKFK